LLGGATSFVYPSLFEGFGLPILEAMHAEVPVITSRTTSMPEVAGKAALLVDPTDVSSIAEALRQLYEQPRLQQQLVAEGQQQRKRFSWAHTAEVVHQAIEKAASEQ
ncbi:MAG TPA: glycosyltransferase, partial [Phaeodactylibacter sp.]|nr:glycosyltransferase [Phaeodactylibacter sp.]